MYRFPPVVPQSARHKRSREPPSHSFSLGNGFSFPCSVPFGSVSESLLLMLIFFLLDSSRRDFSHFSRTLPPLALVLANKCASHGGIRRPDRKDLAPVYSLGRRY